MFFSVTTPKQTFNNNPPQSKIDIDNLFAPKKDTYDIGTFDLTGKSNNNNNGFDIFNKVPSNNQINFNNNETSNFGSYTNNTNYNNNNNSNNTGFNNNMYNNNNNMNNNNNGFNMMNNNNNNNYSMNSGSQNNSFIKRDSMSNSIDNSFISPQMQTRGNETNKTPDNDLKKKLMGTNLFDINNLVMDDSKKKEKEEVKPTNSYAFSGVPLNLMKVDSSPSKTEMNKFNNNGNNFNSPNMYNMNSSPMMNYNMNMNMNNQNQQNFMLNQQYYNQGNVNLNNVNFNLK